MSIQVERKHRWRGSRAFYRKWLQSLHDTKRNIDNKFGHSFALCVCRFMPNIDELFFQRQ